ncbi:substrate-binding domain-containing protein [Tundrisphaera lichenicola]|uniref:substrate-binding domain-containing protein n=1 Tax=Tundrisphaera lichenicola TaxID=2029860 RepID=UPI003EBE7F1B
MVARCALLLSCVALSGSIVAGCGEATGPGGEATTLPTRPVQFVAFDASSRLLEALEAGQLQGTVVQNPFQMGNLGVRTVVDVLEKRPVESKVTTGETLVTPENLKDPEIESILHPPKADGRSDTAANGVKGKKWRVMVIPKGTTHEFWQSVHAGASKAAEELGEVEIVWNGPAREDDRSEQIKLVQTAVASGVDGIVLAPLDARALVEPVDQAIAKGIPVVIIDSALDSEKVSSFVATDNYRGGALAARRLGELIHGEGKVILLRYAVGSASTDEREKGFVETMKQEFPKVGFLSDDQYAGATSDLAQQKSENLLTRFRGQFDGVFCPNESSAVGMLRALERAGLLAKKP